MSKSEIANIESEVQSSIELLTGKQSLVTITEKLNEIIEVINNLPTAKRDRGPKSDRPMTEADAERVLIGDLKDASHKTAAQKLNLSYGQVYSCRNGYTFKAIYKKSLASTTAAPDSKK